jgi:hypothetical protein
MKKAWEIPCFSELDVSDKTENGIIVASDGPLLDS